MTAASILSERIERAILVLRGHRVMLDSDLAALYGVPTKVLLQALKRNPERFPADFMFQMKKQEVAILRSQFVTSSWGGRRYMPYVFTEQGVAMLSSVLNSPRAIAANIEMSFPRNFVFQEVGINSTDWKEKICSRYQSRNIRRSSHHRVSGLVQY